MIRICDRVTVLKNGTFVTTKNIEEVNRDSLISLMVGRKIDDIYNIRRAKVGGEMLRVENLCSKGKFDNISFNIYAGEILGFLGLVGAGRSEVMRAIYGADKLDSGKIYVRRKEQRIRNPISAMKSGIGLIPEDRQKEGAALDLSVKININLNSYDMISKFGWINLKKESERADKYIQAIRIKTPSPAQKVKNLSGGNQQKIVISKLLCRDPDVFIFDEPTVGVDIGAKQEIYQDNYVDLGVDGICITQPYVFGYGNDALVKFYGDLAQATTLPVYIYNAPQTNNTMSPAVVAKIVNSNDNVIGYKDSTQDIIHLQTLMASIPPERCNEVCDLRWFSGCDEAGGYGVGSIPGGSGYAV